MLRGCTSEILVVQDVFQPLPDERRVDADAAILAVARVGELVEDVLEERRPTLLPCISLSLSTSPSRVGP